MNALWRVESATDSNSTWFVGIEPGRISVLAPPGVPVHRCTETDSYRRAGWRCGIWGRKAPDHWPILDIDPPSALREITTRDVLQLLPQDISELVWNLLWNQLQIARRIGIQRDGVVLSEDLARAGATATAWLRGELAENFPDRRDLLEPDSCPAIERALEQPMDPAELLQPLESSAASGWLARKLFPRREAPPGSEERRAWRAGDPLDGSGGRADPGDFSVYGWGNDSGSDSGFDIV